MLKHLTRTSSLFWRFLPTAWDNSLMTPKIIQRQWHDHTIDDAKVITTTMAKRRKHQHVRVTSSINGVNNQERFSAIGTLKMDATMPPKFPESIEPTQRFGTICVFFPICWYRFPHSLGERIIAAWHSEWDGDQYVCRYFQFMFDLAQTWAFPWGLNYAERHC